MDKDAFTKNTVLTQCPVIIGVSVRRSPRPTAHWRVAVIQDKTHGGLCDKAQIGRSLLNDTVTRRPLAICHCYAAARAHLHCVDSPQGSVQQATVTVSKGILHATCEVLRATRESYSLCEALRGTVAIEDVHTRGRRA
jgi:hypothetical protein